ncbi:Myxococcus cysteine-rich repeat-containing protein [Nannocystis exedens]|uniref:Myxococcus cysteine-rich repeat-containing protein n=1 Tax=Nannocystis exedens TaxID=54 RepID=A0A1I2HZZ3_9BACT|nr:DUF4215 domain-containing protein [Nannocystis exedens]PCC73515.1 Virginiamycin B lyase [Nannocystis exedens]SFF35715.1 Myxococcus cysteine-rich repeat-containing protein [Nannocystis exedens]
MPRLTILLGGFFSLTPVCPWYEPELPSGDDIRDDDDHDPDTGAGACGDGVIDPGEECDLGLANADDGACTSACLLAACGDGLIRVGVEQCDDGGNSSSDGCSDTCMTEACTWDLDGHTFPIDVWTGQAVLGEIAFDGDCDLIVGGGEETANIYRVDRNDGSVSLVVQGLPHSMVSGITHRASDDSVYFAAGIPDHLYALDDQDQVESIMPLEVPILSLTVAPQGFGDFGDQLIAVSYGPPQLLAIDVDNHVITPFAQSASLLSVATFGGDGTLYVADWGGDRILTVTADGIFTPFYTGLDAPDGLAIAPDGARMFVAHLSGAGRIDQISLPGATLTPGVEFELGTGAAPTGIVVDGANHVLFEMPLGGHAVVDVFDAP